MVDHNATGQDLWERHALVIPFAQDILLDLSTALEGYRCSQGKACLDVVTLSKLDTACCDH